MKSHVKPGGPHGAALLVQFETDTLVVPEPKFCPTQPYPVFEVNWPFCTRFPARRVPGMPPASAATVKRTKTDLKSDRMMSSNTKNTHYCDMCTRTCTKCTCARAHVRNAIATMLSICQRSSSAVAAMTSFNAQNLDQEKPDHRLSFAASCPSYHSYQN